MSTPRSIASAAGRRRRAREDLAAANRDLGKLLAAVIADPDGDLKAAATAAGISRTTAYSLAAAAKTD